MALHGVIAVNGNTIGGWAATRRHDGAASPKHDDVFTYDCEVHMFGEAFGGARRTSVIVVHRFGDGALELLSKLTAAAARALANPSVISRPNGS